MSVTIIMNQQAILARGEATAKDVDFFYEIRLKAFQHQKNGRPQSYHGPAPVVPLRPNGPNLRSI